MSELSPVNRESTAKYYNQVATIRDTIAVEHFKYLCEMTKYYNDKLIEVFAFFIQTLSLIAGGCFWLATKGDLTGEQQFYMFAMSDIIVGLFGLVTVCRVFGCMTSWYNIRKLQYEAFKGAREPGVMHSNIVEFIMGISVALATIAFCWANPLHIIPAKEKKPQNATSAIFCSTPSVALCAATVTSRLTANRLRLFGLDEARPDIRALGRTEPAGVQCRAA